ncbi:MAG: hypothetical protein M3277_04140 [Actinomycetota bacterium]|nr:hypothetical protein [Actinomycetota bacterium]
MKVVLGVLIGILVGGITVYALVDREDTPAAEVPVPSVAVETPLPETPTPTAAARACSATGLTVDASANAEGLPGPVAARRTEILEAAAACDYEELERLALEGGPFGYSFGVEKSPASFWRARERDARRLDRETSEYLRYLVEILHLPYCKERQDDGTGTETEAVYYVWPRVHCSARSVEDWDDLEGLYTDEQIEEMRKANIYFGFRVGILEDGDWVYFIAGD